LRDAGLMPVEPLPPNMFYWKFNGRAPSRKQVTDVKDLCISKGWVCLEPEIERVSHYLVGCTRSTEGGGKLSLAMRMTRREPRSADCSARSSVSEGNPLENRRLPSCRRATFVRRGQRSKQNCKAIDSRLHRKLRCVERTTPPTHVDSLNGVHRHDRAHRLHK